MTNAAHTPTPWKFEEIAPDDQKWEAFELWNEDATAKMIANGSGTSNMRVFGRANAIFTVRAVNAHDELVEALKDCKAELSAAYNGASALHLSDLPETHPARVAYKKASAALKAAGVE